jgi:hypothetical protein
VETFVETTPASRCRFRNNPRWRVLPIRRYVRTNSFRNYDARICTSTARYGFQPIGPFRNVRTYVRKNPALSKRRTTVDEAKLGRLQLVLVATVIVRYAGAILARHWVDEADRVIASALAVV